MGTIKIPLPSRKYPDLYALIDEEDYELVKPYRWSVRHDRHAFYAQATASSNRGTFVQMHRLILGLEKGVSMVDHIDGDGLNNTRSNLRLCNISQNLANQWNRKRRGLSQYRGVVWNSSSKKWQAQIRSNGEGYYLGVFDSEREAARAYDKAAKLYFGEFARLNLEADDE